MVFESINNLPDFLVDYLIALILVLVYIGVYTFITAHNEFALIRRDVAAASLSLGLSIVGFALPLSSAVVHARTWPDLVVWGLVAMIVQISAYWLVRLAMPNLSQRIANNEIAAALFLGAASLAAGILNAGAMTF
jgi:Predicted membrane protein